ncbi:mitochondrial tricarboxylate transporter [Phaffia rhodozyma]|uniref:Mitochondrial tricarboxylate transporter n=1 Tax=Phaffia rhodozyma TaxID=264483 RepID=A0A0F7SFK5_PHARH|nr:mitochondrial tricarboxylate transporter [Phaffia rhodozyma]
MSAIPKKEPLWASLTAGTIAGMVEGVVTYPTEFVKTQAQFTAVAGQKPPGPVEIIRNTLSAKGPLGLYAGCGALVAGNAVKAGVRFLSYDYYKSLLQDENGKLTAPRSLLAGLGAGMTEAVIAVTPSETIKTKLIEDSRRPDPQFRGLAHGTSSIIRSEGFAGIYRGLSAVMLRQGANSAVRFTTYSTLKQLVQGNGPPGQPLPGGVTFGIGALAGIVTVYSTMPFDVIKTRMQSLAAKTEYRNFIHCGYRIFTEEGILRFWKGTTPRLARLTLSGGIVFYVYEQVISTIGNGKRASA